MAELQGGVLPEPSSSALFLILRVADPKRTGQAVARLAAGTPALTAAVAALDPGAQLVCTVGLGSEFWDVVSRKRPQGLRPFAAIAQGSRRAPNTGGDLLFHILSSRHDLNFELALRIRRQLGEAAAVMEEVHGFRYLDGRDLTGFLDGTQNPKGPTRGPVALIGDEDPDFAGGSYVFTQRYVHDLRRWMMLRPKDQEAVIGRRKAGSEELMDKPSTAHISRVVIEEPGRELEIVYHSCPYGTVSEAGLFFIAYCRTLDTPEKMLARMMGTAGDGLHDQLMDYTRAVSGATFFAPSSHVLAGLVTA